MDREKFNLNPAQLIVGNDQLLLANYAKNLCKKIFCIEDKSCFICLQIDENRHSNIIWLTSEKPYKLSDIDIILDTIKSRCTKIVLDHSEYINEEPIIKYFTIEKIDAPDFLSFIDKSDINEQKTAIILDEILKFWTLKKESRKLDLIIESFENLPGPGGSKLFWKNFYTKFYIS